MIIKRFYLNYFLIFHFNDRKVKIKYIQKSLENYMKLYILAIMGSIAGICEKSIEPHCVKLVGVVCSLKSMFVA